MLASARKRSRSFYKASLSALIFALMLGIVLLAWSRLSVNGIDLRIMYEAGRSVLALENPYRMELEFYTPAWVLLLLTPLSVLPYRLFALIWIISSITTWLLVFVKLRFDRIEIVLFLLNPFLIGGIVLGNYDWLVMAGVLLSPQAAAWLFFLKPQITAGYLAWHLEKIGFKSAYQVYIVPALVLLFTVLLNWYRTPVLSEMPWNKSLGLWGVPLGLLCLYAGIKENDPVVALGATPFLFPYVALQSWFMPYLMFRGHKGELFLATLFGWSILVLQ